MRRDSGVTEGGGGVSGGGSTSGSAPKRRVTSSISSGAEKSPTAQKIVLRGTKRFVQ